MTSVNENIKRLEELSQEDGTGGLLVCYETGREKPHADSSYQLYPVNPDQKGMTYQFSASCMSGGDRPDIGLHP